MSTIKAIEAIASALANVLAAGLEEMRRRQRREQNFRWLTRHRTRLPFFVGGKVRFGHVPRRTVTFFQPGTRLPWRSSVGTVRVSLAR